MDQVNVIVKSTFNKATETDEEIDVSATVEAVLGLLLNGLSHEATVVRWNAAKQLGRVVERIDRENGEHVIDAVLDLADELNSEDTWHGAMSALAEFTRRNLIQKEQLTLTIEVIKSGLKFDKRRGDGSIGSNVRDAACYAAWTLV